MADQLQIRGGDTASNNSFTGAQRELSIDTSLNQLIVHDGVTTGGHKIPKTDDPSFTGTASFTGDVGIGTSSPAARLDVARLGSAWTGASPAVGTALLAHNGNNSPSSPAAVQISSGSSSPSSLFFGDEDNSGSGEIRYNHGDDSMNFKVNNSDRLRIDSSGRVGIGQANPQAGLNVKSDNSELALFEVEGGEISTPANLMLTGTSTSGNVSQQVELSAYQPTGGGGSDTALNINVRKNGDAFNSPNTVATFLGSGNVLIGGTLPASPNISLNADGTATFAGTITASNIAAFKSNLIAAATAATTLADLKTALIDALTNDL